MTVYRLPWYHHVIFLMFGALVIVSIDYYKQTQNLRCITGQRELDRAHWQEAEEKKAQLEKEMGRIIRMTHLNCGNAWTPYKEIEALRTQLAAEKKARAALEVDAAAFRRFMEESKYESFYPPCPFAIHWEEKYNRSQQYVRKLEGRLEAYGDHSRESTCDAIAKHTGKGQR